MIKTTLYFGNPAYLSLKDGQMVIKLPEEKSASGEQNIRSESVITKPIEDVGVVVIDNRRITITSGLIDALLDNNVALITCNSKNMPTGLMLTLNGNTIQSERYQDQVQASLPLKKQLWQQVISQKIHNQAHMLLKYSNVECGNMLVWSRDVRSGDPDNLEARAAAYYWKNIFTKIPHFV